MPRLLDLFCGAGGAAMGYHRAGFEVVGVDHLPQPRYPFEFVQADALEYCAAHGAEYDVVHASPPCQAYCMLRNSGRTREHPDLVSIVRDILLETGRPWVVENVQGAPLRDAVIVCGHSLGLRRLARHRHFESSILLFGTTCTHRGKGCIGVYGQYPDGARVSPFRRNGHTNYRAASLQEAQEAMGIDWMTWRELTQAIPPAYTEFIGKQLMQALEGRSSQHIVCAQTKEEL